MGWAQWMLYSAKYLALSDRFSCGPGLAARIQFQLVTYRMLRLPGIPGAFFAAAEHHNFLASQLFGITTFWHHNFLASQLLLPNVWYHQSCSAQPTCYISKLVASVS